MSSHSRSRAASAPGAEKARPKSKSSSVSIYMKSPAAKKEYPGLENAQAAGDFEHLRPRVAVVLLVLRDDLGVILQIDRQTVALHAPAPFPRAGFPELLLDDNRQAIQVVECIILLPFDASLVQFQAWEAAQQGGERDFGLAAGERRAGAEVNAPAERGV